ncbi:hypothetical protein DAEQUDRAFT_721611 [Daedalea quercina L-15889]|uniref:Uncharacterized protein n=1 Tax=Daedalea quercina L-15889 TaxID=1314783 RepID=A0A165TJY6_9APHY|nr:hypothetical protein DAEQUDRAFT_721611 [Daedalea quercina L-15889]
MVLLIHSGQRTPLRVLTSSPLAFVLVLSLSEHLGVTSLLPSAVGLRRYQYATETLLSQRILKAGLMKRERNKKAGNPPDGLAVSFSNSDWLLAPDHLRDMPSRKAWIQGHDSAPDGAIGCSNRCARI